MSDLRQLVINFLTARPRATPGLIAAHVGERVADVQGVLNALASEGLVRMSFPIGALQPACELAKQETIGECELCGVTDHHLVDSICPTCRLKCMTVSADRAVHADGDGTGYCRGCGTTIGEPHHPSCDLALTRRGRA